MASDDEQGARSRGLTELGRALPAERIELVPTDERAPGFEAAAFEPPPPSEAVLELDTSAAPPAGTLAPLPREPPPPPAATAPTPTAFPRAAPNAAHCRRHRDRAAGWRCDGCGADLCPACTHAYRVSVGKSLPACGICHRAARAITVARSFATPIGVLVRGALLWPLRPAGLVFIVSISALGLLPLVGWIAHAIAWAYLFALVRSSGEGAATLLPSDGLSEGPEDLLKPAFRGVAVTGWLWVPAAFYLERHYEFLSGGASILAIARDPVTWLLPLVGLPSLPIAAMAAATDVSIADLFNPLFLGRAVRRIGRDYWHGTAVVGALGLLTAGAILAIAATAGDSAVGALMHAAVLNYFALACARVVGGMLYLHGYAIGWGDEAAYRVPVLGAIAPAGDIRAPTRA